MYSRNREGFGEVWGWGDRKMDPSFRWGDDFERVGGRLSTLTPAPSRQGRGEKGAGQAAWAEGMRIR